MQGKSPSTWMMMTKDTNQYFKIFFLHVVSLRFCCLHLNYEKLNTRIKVFRKKKIEKKRVQKEYI